MKVALVGNQNSGKTTLFNYLTGMNGRGQEIKETLNNFIQENQDQPTILIKK